MLKALSVALALAGATSVVGAAQAEISMSAGQLGDALATPNVEQAQFLPFIFGGRNYCWYDSGWRGPGWYWCGYAWRSGYGWGGGDGWRGWRRDQWRGGRGHRPGQVIGRPVGRPDGHHGRPGQVIGRPVGRPGGHMGGGMHMGGGNRGGGMHMGGGGHGGGMHMGGGGHGGGMHMGGGGHGGGGGGKKH